MPGKQIETALDSRGSAQKLVEATLSAWETHGSAGISARSLATAAGLQVSSIYYHFGDLERLSDAAQVEARRLAALWCDEQLEAIGHGATGSAALGPLLATLVDDWCQMQRPLAFAWRECQLMALLDARHAESCTAWGALWQRFWTELCCRLDLTDMAISTAWIFEGMAAYHLLRWRRAVDRPALDEMCNGWATWLDGRLAEPSAWFELGRRNAIALTAPSSPDDAIAATISEAAATTVARGGAAALTHRAVAAEAGVTLGLVSYRFRTSADLLQAAFEAIYRRLVPEIPGDGTAIPDISRADAVSRFSGSPPLRENLLGMEALLVAAARDPALQSFAAQLRYLRGRTSGLYLQAMLGPERPIAPLDAAIFSALLSARGRAHACSGRDASPEDSVDFAPLLVRLEQGSVTAA